MIKKNKIIIGCLMFALIFIVGFSAYQRAFKSDGANSNGADNTPIIYEEGSEASYAVDLNIDENLVGGSQNIFVGKVVGQSANQQIGSQTQFDVNVVSNIKGNLRGMVVVNTNTWYYNGEIRVMKGSVWPESGSTYLFATRYDSAHNWYTVISFYVHQVVSWKLISDNSSLTTAQLQELANNDPRVKQLQAAYPREISDRADVYNNNVRNSYQSLTEAQKAALPYYVPPPAPPAPQPASSTASSTGY